MTPAPPAADVEHADGGGDGPAVEAPSFEAGYGSALSHLLDEVLSVRLRFERVCRARELRERLGLRGAPAGADELADQEALARYIADLDRSVNEQRARIDGRLDRTPGGGRGLPIQRLVRRLALSVAERELVLTLLAPEIDPAVARDWAALGDDPVRPWPKVGLLLELLGDGLSSQDAVRDLLDPAGTLRGLRLVLVERDSPDRPIEASFLGRHVKLAERVVAHLRGRDRPDESIADFCRAYPPRGTLEELVVPDTLRARLDGLVEASRVSTRPLRLHLHGAEGSGRKFLVEGLLGALAPDGGSPPPLLVADWTALLAKPAHYVERLLLLGREAVLTGAHLHLEALEELPPEALGPTHAVRLAAALAGLPCGVSLAAQQPLLQLHERVEGLVTLALPFPEPDDRTRLWELALADQPISPQVEFSDLGHKYVLTGGAIRRAAASAWERAAARNGGEAVITPDDLDRDSRAQSSRGLVQLTDRMEKWFTFDDAILASETLHVLEAMLAFARNRRFILDDWGFRRMLPYGQGLGVMFTGPPGTGKTMVATIIARELGMEIYRIDLSRVVNKYIGETEKNLSRIFDEARGSNCILLFDEADALFARRTEVRSSVDRYANLEVNYLLQRMEQHDGVTILTTNFEGSIDKAFRRRLKFHVYFPLPGEEQRAELWERLIPEEADRAEEIRFPLLGSEFEFSGGTIKNAVLRAAVFAAELGESISEDLLFEAAEEEAQESGKLVQREREES